VLDCVLQLQPIARRSPVSAARSAAAGRRLLLLLLLTRFGCAKKSALARSTKSDHTAM
jgi:hypothetical protein